MSSNDIDSRPPSGPEDVLHRSVYTSDGRYLGKTVRVEDGWFRVDVPQELDYWLPFAAVRALVHNQVLLSLDIAEVRTRRRHEHPTSAERRLEQEQESGLYEFADRADSLSDDEDASSVEDETSADR